MALERFEFYRSIRQMGMGGASIGVVNDQTALLLNPAGLGRLREFYLTLADPTIESTQNVNTMAGGVQNALSMKDPQKALTNANANPGQRFHLMGNIFPSLVFPNFGIGVLGKYQNDFQDNLAATNFEYYFTQDLAVVSGVNFRLLDGIIKIGATGRLIDRSEIYQPTLATNSTGLTYNGLVNEGVGLAGDGGIIITMPWAWLPSIAGVIRDIGGTTYGLRSGVSTANTSKPRDTPQTIDAAFTLQPILDNHLRMQVTFEARDVLDAYVDKYMLKRAHAGFELNWGDALFVRGGYNQGYWTAGLEIAVLAYQIQFASYGEEVGDDKLQQEDRRYMLNFSIRF